MHFGEKLYELRKNWGLSQKELANWLNVSQASINYWEKGQRTPSLEIAKKIAIFFDVSLSALTSAIAEDIDDAFNENINSTASDNFDFLCDSLKYVGCHMQVSSKNVLGNREITYTLFYNGKHAPLNHNDLEELNDDIQDYIIFKAEQLLKRKANTTSSEQDQ